MKTADDGFCHSCKRSLSDTSQDALIAHIFEQDLDLQRAQKRLANSKAVVRIWKSSFHELAKKLRQTKSVFDHA